MYEKTDIIGKRVMERNSGRIGTIKNIKDEIISIEFHDEIYDYPYPSCFTKNIELEDETVQDIMQDIGIRSSFDRFICEYTSAINKEIYFLKSTGGKKYYAFDGHILKSKASYSKEKFFYTFDTDTDIHFQNDTPIKIYLKDRLIKGHIVNSDDFTMTVCIYEYIGEKIETIQFNVEQWLLLEKLVNQLYHMTYDDNTIAYQIACTGTTKIQSNQRITLGCGNAIKHALNNPITFIWGPPGTGKTETLANISMEYMKLGKRVLMLSYSNVSVDGALIRLAKKLTEKMDNPDGKVIRYGYPRMEEIVNSEILYSYLYVMRKHPELKKQYDELTEQKQKLKSRSKFKYDEIRLKQEKNRIDEQLHKIRQMLLDEEKRLISSISFVATTVSKAVIDEAVFSQKFDAVIFDEASMAYIPQIIFASGLAKSHFVCLGDFCQLPPIVQEPTNEKLKKDIFAFTGITGAVEQRYSHQWLVMLNTQYRMHSQIADFVNKNMYNGLLATDKKIDSERNKIAAGRPVSMIDLSGTYSVCTRTRDKSRVNLMSAMLCIRVAEKYIDKYDVGIITPYNAQSRLIFSIIRDLREKDEKYMRMSSATVHQFQGSEKSVIIYDATDCFRCAYPGTLLTSTKNDTANRLFNVAMTRAKAKFIIVANKDYFIRKHISPHLMFTKLIDYISDNQLQLSEDEFVTQVFSDNTETSAVYVNDKKICFDLYIENLMKANKKIVIDLHGFIDDDDKKMEKLLQCLKTLQKRNISIMLKTDSNVVLPDEFAAYILSDCYVSTPVTVIDNQIVWFGQPLFADDFISEKSLVETKYFPCFRFSGKHMAKELKLFLG